MVQQTTDRVFRFPTSEALSQLLEALTDHFQKQGIKAEYMVIQHYLFVPREVPISVLHLNGEIEEVELSEAELAHFPVEVRAYLNRFHN